MSQPNGEHHDGKDGEKFALPVLHRLEPELRICREFPKAARRLAVLERLLAVLGVAAPRVQNQRDGKQEEECEPQRIPVLKALS